MRGPTGRPASRKQVINLTDELREIARRTAEAAPPLTLRPASPLAGVAQRDRPPRGGQVTGYMVVEWTRSEGYADTGIRPDTYAEAEAEGCRLHRTYGPQSRYLPMSLRRAIDLGVLWSGVR
jgi:hypothetical protein